MKQPNVLPALLAAAVSLAPTFAVGTTAPPTKGQVTQALFGLAVPFEENKGQVDSTVAFQARTLAGPLFVTTTGELVWSLTSATAPVCTVVERFVGGQLSPAGAVPAVTRVSYLRGNDPAKWQRDVPTWQQVSLGQVWPGISVDVAAHGKNAEKIFTLAPGAEVKAITVAVEGGSLQLEANGNLRVSRADKPLVSFSTPVAWQEINGQRHSVQVAYRLADAGKYGFTLGAYDAKHAVMIDPVLQSTYLGGTGEEAVNAIAATTSGIYVAGLTTSINFPDATGGYVPTNTGTDDDAFVARLATDLKTIQQATYLGGAAADEALAIAVTANSVYIAGVTASDSFPGVTGGVDATRNAGDAFVTKLGLNLTLPDPDDIQSTYFGGTGDESAKALAVNTVGVFIAGDTTSTDLTPVTGSVQTTKSTGTDAFIAKLPLSLTGSTGIQATYFGGTGADTANAIALSGTTAVYIAGSTTSVATGSPLAGGLPFTTGGAQAALATDESGGDAYVARFGQNLLASNAIKQATYLGGIAADVANALAVTTVVYVAGTTDSSDFPFITNGMDTEVNADDGFVTRLNIDLKANTVMQQSTFVGGTGDDAIYAMAVNSVAVYVAGETAADDLPFMAGGAQPALVGAKDAFVARLGLSLKSASTLKQTTYLGGDGNNDSANAIAIATDNTVYVAGVTNSSNFPTTTGSEDTAADATNGDGFVTKFTTELRAAAPLAETTAATSITDTGATLNGNVTPQGADTTVTFNLGTTTAYGSNIAATTPTDGSVTAMLGKTNVSVTVTAAADALLCGTTYHYQVVAQNSISTTRGADKTFVLPCAPTVATAAPAIDVTSAILKGTVDANGGQALTVSFLFGDESVTYSAGPVPPNSCTTANLLSNGCYDSSMPANPSNVTGDEGIEVTANKTGLTCGVTYHYRVKAVKAGTTTAIYSDERSFITNSCSAPIVTTAAASNITATSAKLLGSVNYGGAATTVEFQFSPTGVYTDAVGTKPATYTVVAATPGSVNTPGVISVSADKPSLACFTRYHYRIKAKNKVNNVDMTSYGNSLFFQTLGCKPIVQTQAATFVSVLQANLNGQVISNGANATVTFDIGTSATSFDILGIAAGTAPVMLIVPGTPATGIYNALVTRDTGLSCGKTFFYRAKASNSFGATTAPPVSFTTPACTPVIATLPATNITSETLQTVKALLVGTVDPKGLRSVVTFDFGPSISYGYSVPVTSPAAVDTDVDTDTNPDSTLAAGNNAGSVLPFQTVPPISVTGPVSAGTALTDAIPGTAPAYPNLTIDCGGVYNYRVKAINYGGVGTGYVSGTSPAITGANQVFTTKACAPVVTSLAANDTTISGAISSNGATLKGTVDANGANTQVFFELGLTPSSGDVAYEPAVAATPASVAGTTATKVSLAKTGLACGRGYTYRVKAVNTVDGVVNTIYSDTKAFTTVSCNPTVTTDAAATSTPTAEIAGTISTNNVTLYGTVTYAGDVSATASSTVVTPYFDLGLTTAYTTTDQVATVGTFYEVNGVKKFPVTLAVTGLTCGNKTYNFRLKAVKPTGASPTSAAAVTVLGLNRTFTTLPCTQVASVTTLDATFIKKDRVTLEGSVKTNGSDTIVTFDFGTTTSYGTSVADTTLTGSNDPTTETAVDVEVEKAGLICGTTYNYRVKAVNSAGTTLGANKTFTTVCPPVITTENATNIKQDTATIRGIVDAKNSNSTVTFDFGTANDLAGSTSLAANPGLVSRTANTPVLFNLTSTQLTAACGTTYYYRVKAVNNVANQGSGTENTVTGAIKSFTTVCAPTVVTSNPEGQAVYNATTKVTAILKGTVDTGNNGAATASFDFGTNTNYGTKIAVTTPANGTIPTANSAATAVAATVPKLACGVVYHYRTRAVNAGNVDIANGQTGDQVGDDKAINAICPAGATTNNATGITTTTSDVTATLNGLVTATNKQAVANGEPATPATTATFLFAEASKPTPASGNGAYTTAITTLTAGGTTAGNVNGTVSHNLTASTTPGLTCGKAYYYRLKLVNSDTTTITGVHGGGTTYGVEKSFNTAPCTHTAVTAVPTGVTATGATLNGVVNPKNLASGINIKFDIGLASNPAGTYSGVTGGTDIAATTPAGGTNTGNIDVQASVASPTLTANTAYRYRVKATHTATPSTGTVYGADVIFTTPAAAPQSGEIT